MADKATGILARLASLVTTIGSAVGASLSADIVAVKSVVDGGATTTDLNKVPKSDGSTVWNATAQTTIQTKAKAALDAYDPPTRTEATSDKDEILAGQGGGLTAKQLAILGASVSGSPALIEYVSDVAAAADPNTSKWNLTQDNDAIVTHIIGGNTEEPFWIFTGGSGGNSCGISSGEHYAWGINYAIPPTSIIMEGYTQFGDLTSRGYFGFTGVTSSLGDASVTARAGAEPSGIYCDNDTVLAVSSDGTLESTDVSAYFSDGTKVKVKIVITASAVNFFIDDTLRATHTTRISSNVLMAAAQSTNANGVQSNIRVYQGLTVWTE